MYGIELFSGAGGLSLGAQWAGVQVTHAVDFSEPAAKTFSHNHPLTKVIVEDIRKLSGAGFAMPGRPLILFGGPPCQGFSTSNQKNRNLNNPNNWLFSEFVRIARETDPDAIVFENVAGITHTAGGFFERSLKTELKSIGYRVNSVLAEGTELGLPQKRVRYFCVATKKKKIDLQNISKSTQAVTVHDAIADLPLLSVGNSVDIQPYNGEPISKYAKLLRGDLRVCTGHMVTRNAPHIVERYKYVPQGGNWSNIPRDLMQSYKDASRCHTGIYRRLNASEPSVVLGNFRKNMLIHPSQDRGLSVREAARLQSFPDSYEFMGTIGQQQQQVGNAVPPLMAEKVFRCIFDQLN